MNNRERKFFLSANFHFSSPREVYRIWCGLHSLFLFIFFQGPLWKNTHFQTNHKPRRYSAKLSLIILLRDHTFHSIYYLEQDWCQFCQFWATGGFSVVSITAAYWQLCPFPAASVEAHSLSIAPFHFSPYTALASLTDHGREKVGELKQETVPNFPCIVSCGLGNWLTLPTFTKPWLHVQWRRKQVVFSLGSEAQWEEKSNQRLQHSSFS